MRASEPYALRGDILEVLNQQRLFKSQMAEDGSSEGMQEQVTAIFTL